MAIVDSGCKKEETILGLAQECRRRAGYIKAVLYEHFVLPETSKDKCIGRPTWALLDEIIETLSECLKSQQETIVFLQQEVFPKIH